MAEKLSPQAVSARLANAGFIRSTKSPSRIRGMSEHFSGFVVESWADGSVKVAHKMGSFRRGDHSEAMRGQLARYREVLIDAGLDAELREDVGINPALIVKKKEVL